MYRSKLNEKLQESLAAVLPILAIVLILSFTIAPLPTSVLMAFLFGAVLLVVGVVQQLGEDSMSFSIDDFLSKVLLIIMGIEFVKMLMLHTYGAVIDVLLFAMARQMIVTHNGPEGTLISVLSVAVIFAIKKFLYTGESWEQRRQSPSVPPEDSGPES